LVGCIIINAAPKQAENVALGSFTPSSVPATYIDYQEIQLPKCYKHWASICKSKLSTGRAEHLVTNHYQSGIATDEMIHGLCQVQLAHWWEYTKCITCQKDNILWVRTNTWYLRIRNVLDRVGCSSVLCKSCKGKQYKHQIFFTWVWSEEMFKSMIFHSPVTDLSA
jgi:hypothetical protein